MLQLMLWEYNRVVWSSAVPGHIEGKQNTTISFIGADGNVTTVPGTEYFGLPFVEWNAPPELVMLVVTPMILFNGVLLPIALFGQSLLKLCPFQVSLTTTTSEAV